MTLEQLSKRCKDSPIEIRLLNALYPRLTPPWIEELHAQYMIDYYQDIPVTLPDFAFPDAKIAIYCDDYESHKKPKRFYDDRRQSRELQLQGWLVLRFTGKEINSNIDEVVSLILKALNRQIIQVDSPVQPSTARSRADSTKVIEMKLNNANAYIEQGDYYMMDKFDYDSAIVNYTIAIQLEPDNANTYFWRGLAYAFKNNYDSAIVNYTIAIQLNPNDDLNYVVRGNAYKRKFDYDSAIEDYTIAIQLNPNDDSNYLSRGEAYSNKFDYDSAVKDYTKVTQLEPDQPVGYLRRGQAYYQSGDYNNAIVDYTQAVQLGPYNPRTYYCRGMAFLEKYDYDRADADFATARELRNTQ